jgi:hypothetical protein
VRPELKNGNNVVASCPDCGGRSTFESKSAGTPFGRIDKEGVLQYDGQTYHVSVYHLLRCASCGRGALATSVYAAGSALGVLHSFSPVTSDKVPLPKATPKDIQEEVREAERCAAVGAWRAGSAMLRSALEKTLKANGYTTGSLKDKIDEAAADGVITDARKQRAHDEVRDLGTQTAVHVVGWPVRAD